MTIVADHPLSGPAFASLAASEQAFSEAWAKRVVAVSAFVDECLQGGVEVLRVPLSHAPSEAMAGSRYFVVRQDETRLGYSRYHVSAEASDSWGRFPVGSGPHYADGADKVSAEFGHYNLGEHVFVGELDGKAIFVPAPQPEADLGGSSTSTCPVYSWCTEDHTAPHTDMSFHIGADKREPLPAVLRADIVLDDDEFSLEVCDTLEWRVPMEEVPQFIAKLRTEVDRIEALAAAFPDPHHPLKRLAEPVVDGSGVEL